MANTQSPPLRHRMGVDVCLLGNFLAFPIFSIIRKAAWCDKQWGGSIIEESSWVECGRVTSRQTKNVRLPRISQLKSGLLGIVL